ncbi:hypothetical protein [Actinoplanes sp. GCM10030250]|uniref:hypothetical protein n=1 Tax=Actinoplanes sp. GCM10030250 TaxID=3273376 RepID=UPI00360EEB27
MRMRTILKSAIAAGFAAGALAVPSAALADDNGDGNEPCNYTEICFQYIFGNNQYGKQFYNGANHYANGAHGAYRWWDSVNDVRLGINVMDEAQGFRNRDSACTAWLWDVDGSGNWYTYHSQPKNYGSFLNTGGDRNNGHSRCNANSPANL